MEGRQADRENKLLKNDDGIFDTRIVPISRRFPVRAKPTDACGDIGAHSDESQKLSPINVYFIDKVFFFIFSLDSFDLNYVYCFYCTQVEQENQALPLLK